MSQQPADEPSLITYLEAFETTSARLNETEAVGLLNFAALFHERVYINDTPLGDSDVLIRSFASEPGGGKLYRTVKHFLAAGILVPHWRDQFSISGEPTARKPERLVDLYGFWKQRDAELRERRVLSANDDLFTCDIHDDRRIEFYEDLNGVIDVARNKVGGDRAEYSVDRVKERFRNHIRTLSDSDGPFREALSHSGHDVELHYRSACNERYFTIATLWNITRRSPASTRSLSRLQGMVNQESYGHAVHSGIQGMDDEAVSGSSLSASLDATMLAANLRHDRGQFEASLDYPRHLPKTFGEAYESARIRLEIPDLYVLSALRPKDITTLRDTGKALCFGFAHSVSAYASLNLFMQEYLARFTRYVDAILAYCIRHHSRSAGIRMARACVLSGDDALTIAERCELNGDVGYVDFGSHVSAVVKEVFSVAGIAAGGALGALSSDWQIAVGAAVLGWYVGRSLDAAASATAEKLRGVLPGGLVLLFERDPALNGLRTNLKMPTDWVVRHVYAAQKWYA